MPMTLAEEAAALKADFPHLNEDALLNMASWLRRLDRAIARDMGRTSTTCKDCHGIGHLTHNPTIECPRCGGEGRV